MLYLLSHRRDELNKKMAEMDLPEDVRAKLSKQLEKEEAEDAKKRCACLCMPAVGSVGGVVLCAFCVFKWCGDVCVLVPLGLFTNTPHSYLQPKEGDTN